MKKNILKFMAEAGIVAAISLLILLPVRLYIFQPFYVMGASMEPSLQNQDYLLIDEITYKFDNLKRGDIIVFHYPLDPQERFIKRVIGLPGEKVQIKDGAVYIYREGEATGTPLEESYLPAGTKTYALSSEPVSLGADEYYVLGDNRPYSDDSRIFGPVKKNLIIGRVFFRGWPPDEITLFPDTPPYNL